MNYFYIYLAGCLVNILMICLHYCWGLLTISACLRNNYRKVGVFVSLLGGIGFERDKIRNLIFDIAFSWFAVAANAFNLLRRIFAFVGSFTAPNNVKDLAYRVSHFALTAEEVCLCDIKSKHFLTNLPITRGELHKHVQFIVGRGFPVNEEKVAELLIANNLLKKDAA